MRNQIQLLVSGVLATACALTGQTAAAQTVSRWNAVDNPDQIDTPSELEQGENTPGELSAADLSKELSNPNSPLANLTFKHTYTTYQGSLPGAGQQSGHATLFQPAFPFPLGDDGTTNLFIRPAITYLTNQPVWDAGTGQFVSRSGFADIGFDIALGRSYDSGVMVIGGIQGTIPVGNDLSGDQWRLGPEFVVGKMWENSFLIAFPSHQWDVGGKNYDYSTTRFELFAGVHLENAWTVLTNPKMSYDWETDQATVPVNLTIRKITKIGNTPLKLELAADYFVERDSAFGADWALSFNITPIVPNFIYNAIRK